MGRREAETVIVAMSQRHGPDVMVRRLVEDGRQVVGPATTASMALALAAQAPATLAVIHAELDGRRDGHQLADALSKNWGLPCVVIEVGETADGPLPLGGS